MLDYFKLHSKSKIGKMLLNDSVDSPNLTKSSPNRNPLSISRESGGLNSELLPSQSSAFSSSSRKTRSGPADFSKKNSSSLFTSVPSTGPLKPLDSAADKADSANNKSMTHLKYEDHQNYSLSKTSGFRVLICVMVPLFVIGFTAGGFILISVHNAILLLVVISIFGFVVGVLVWNVCWGKDAVVGVLLGYTDAELGRAKEGQYVKVTGVVSCGSVSLESSYEKVSKCVYTSTSLYEYRGLNENPASSKQRRFTWGLRYLERNTTDFYISELESGLRALVKAGHSSKVTPYVDETTIIDIASKRKELSSTFINWLRERNLPSNVRKMRLKEGYIKEGSTISVMGIVQRNDNELMIVPPSEPISTGCEWRRFLLPVKIEGIVLRCEDNTA